MKPVMSPDPSNQNSGQKSTRRDARELALRMLYQVDLGHQPVDEVVEAALAQSQLDPKNSAFAQDLVRGTVAHRLEIDRRLSEVAVDWATERQAVVDRNILRLAAYEMFHRPDSPVAAVVNEAVELAKKYSTSESGRFVNGVLGALARHPRGDHAVAEGQQPGIRTEVGESAPDSPRPRSSDFSGEANRPNSPAAENSPFATHTDVDAAQE